MNTNNIYRFMSGLPFISDAKSMTGNIKSSSPRVGDHSGAAFRGLTAIKTVLLMALGLLAVRQSTHAQITNGMNASDIIGQYTTTAGFTPNWTQTAIHNNNGSVYALGFNAPRGILIDDVDKRMFICDDLNHRILVYNLDANGNLVDKTPDFVLGQTNFTSNSSGTSATKFLNPNGVAYDTQTKRLFVSEDNNNRVTVFDVTSITNGEAAINVLGQPDFTTSTAGTTQTKLGAPSGVIFDQANNRLFVSGGNRVMVFDVASITNGEPAINVLGQPDFTTGTASVSQTGMSGSRAMAYDASRQWLFVPQGSANRITVYDVTSITNGEAAIHVLGQPDFTSSTIATTQAGLSGPNGLSFYNNILYVVDQDNNRVVTYDVASITNGENAVNVLGQPNFTSSTAATTQAGMNAPSRILMHAPTGKLYVSQNNSHRYTIFQVIAPLAATTAVTSTCPSATNGAIDLTVTGGNPPYTYLWSNAATTQDISGLAPGTYTVTITPSLGATLTASATVGITGGANPTINGAIAPVATAGGNTGAIELTVTGGSAPYTYAWSNAATTQDITGLTAGAYTVTITQSNTCTSTQTFTVSTNLANKQLYLSDPSQALDRVSPVATGDATTAQSPVLGIGTTITDTIYSTKASYIYEGNPNRVYGSDGILFLTHEGSSFQGRSFIQFDLSTIPAGATITNATMRVVKRSFAACDGTSGSGGTFNITVRSVNGPWVEGSVCNTAEAGSLSWNNAPAFGATELGSFNGGNANPGGTEYTVNLTTAAQGWYSAPSTNFGVALFKQSGASTSWFHLHSDDSPNGVNHPSLIITYTTPLVTSTSFTQTPVLASPLTIKAGNPITITNHVTVTGGTMPSNPTIGANLRYGATTIASLTNPTYNAGAGTLTWTTTPGADVTVPAGQAIVLDVTTSQSGVGFTIDYDSQTDPSRIDLPVSTYIDVSALDVYTAAHPGGSIITSAAPGTTVYLRSTVTDPFGSADITGMDIRITAPGGGITNVTGTSVATTGNSRTYEYVWVVPAGGGIYTIDVFAKEGFENSVIGTKRITFGGCNPAFAASLVSQTNISCFGQSTGAFTVAGVNGSSPYTYRIGTGAYQSSGTFTGLAAGTYTVTARDAGLCTATLNVTITQPAAALAVTPTITQPSCFAFGSITLTVSGGTAPYTYDWADVPGTNNPKDRTGLAAGTYSVTVTDANGCTVASGALTLNPASACGPVTVCRSNTSSVFSVAPNPDNSSYTWTVPAGAIIVSGQGTPSIVINWTGATPGTGQICVTAMNICGTSAQTCQQVNIVAPPVPNVMAGPACLGGTLQLLATGGSTYSWTGPNAFASGSANPTIGDLSASNNGTYSVTVTNAAGCSATGSVAVTVSARPQATLTIVNNAVCGQNTGTIDLTVTSGTPAYTYAWSNGATTQDLSNLASGSYVVTVTDVVGCTTASGTGISDLPGPSLSSTQTNVSCNGGNNGAINLTITGGTAPLSILWSNGSTMEDLSGLTAGNYSVTVTDNAGCVAARQVTITQPLGMLTEANQVNVNCFGASTGSISTSTTGGSLPYTYTWTRNGVPFGGNTPSLTGLSSGTYALTVSDANSCTRTISAIITQPAAALNATAAVTNVDCFGGSNGQVILTTTGGTAPYTYAWTGPGGFTATTKDIIGRIAGTYNVTVTDGKGCTFPLTGISITQPALLAVSSAVPANVSCFGGANGSINATIAGGTMPYTYLWSNGSSVQDPSGLTAGNYSLTVTDVNGCTAVSGNVTVGGPAAALTATPTVTNANCNGASTGSISLAVSGGTGTYTYNWTGTGTGTNPRTNLAAGVYSVTITDANLCTIVRSANVGQPAAITASEFITTVACNGGNTGAINLTVTGGTGVYTFAWSGGLPATEDQTGLSAGTYTVTITDANLCTGTRSITVSQPAVLAATGTQVNVSCNGAANGSVNLTATGGTTPYTFAWSSGANTEDVSGLAPGTYTVTVTDFRLCTATQTFTITEPATLSFTNTITPNCTAQSNGSVALTVSGGTSPFTYNWTGTGAGTNPRTGLAAGTYTVTVTDNRGCTTTGSFTLVPVSVLVEGFNSNCLGSNGQVLATPSGGLTPYTYLWSNSATTQNISGLSSGTFTVTVTAGACTATGQATLVAPACQPPVAVDDQYITVINTPVSGTVRANDTDPVFATNTLNIEAITTLDPSIGVIVWDPSGNGNFTFTPAANFVGDVTINYQVCNPAALCDDGVLTIRINYTLAQNDINQTPINTPVSGNVLTNDSDPQGDTQTVTSAQADTDGDGLVDDVLPVATSTTIYGPNNNGVVVVAGTVILNANGTYTYTPAANFTGNAPFAYTVTDNSTAPASDNATVNIEVIPTTVIGVNEPPVANDDTNVTEQGIAVSDNVLPNDSDPDGDVITVTSALADTDGDGQIDDVLPLGTTTTIYGVTFGNTVVVAGTLVLNSTGAYTFTPNTTFTGDVPTRYTISDPSGLTDNATLTITVVPDRGNTTFANDDANSGPQGVVQTGNIRTNDFDPEGNTQTVTAAQNSANAALVVNGVTANVLPSGGTLVLAANGAYTYTPAENFTGTEIIRYTVSDNGSPVATDMATLYLTTLPINNTFAQNDINQTPINTPVSGIVGFNDFDPQGDTQTVTSAQADTDGDGQVDDVLPLGVSTTIYGPNNNGVVVVAGTVELDAGGTYTYTPATNFTGNAPFAYTVTDNSAAPASDNATVNIEVIPTTVIGVNEPPVANDDTNTTEQDVNVSGNVLTNDSDPDGDVITVTSSLADTDGDGQVDDPLTLGTPTPVSGINLSGATVPAGTITLNANGSYTFDPLPTFTGNVPVQYTISDPLGLTDNAVLAITVIPNLGNTTFANEDANVGPQGVVQTGNILTNDFDPEGNTQTVIIAADGLFNLLVVDGVTANVLPSGGTLVLAPNGAYTYTPAAGFIGTEIIFYAIEDNGSPVANALATLYLTTLPINNTFAQNDINQTPVNTPVAGNVLTNDSDPQGNTQTVTSALADTDGDGQVDDNLPLGVNTTIYGTNNANTVVVAGTVTLNANGTYTYTPATNYEGTVPFAYTITDNNLSPATASATVAIEVIPTSIPGNEPPVANNDTNTTEQDVNVSGSVLPNDSDPDGDVITVTSSLADTDGDGQVDDPLTLGSPTPVSGINASGATVPAGTITLNSNGTYTFDPLPTFTGNVPVQYTISDPLGLTDNAVLAITVIPNQGNTTFANDDANSGPQGMVQTGNLLTNDFDPEGNTQTVTAAVSSANTALVVNGVTANVLPSGGTLVLFANGAYTYTPAANFTGTEIIRYTVTDNGSPVDTDVATLYLTTLPINNTLAQNDINQTPVNTPVGGNVLTNDSDPQGNTQTVTSALADTDGDGQVDDNLPLGVNTTIYGTNNANTVVVAGTVTLNANGTYTYTPATNYEGTVPFAYTITDNNLSPATASATVAIEVIPTSIPGNEPPVANNDTNTTEQDVTVSGSVMPNDSDPDGDVITVTSSLADTDGDGQVDDPLTLGAPTPVSGTNTSGAVVPAGTITLNSNGTYTFDPLPTFIGSVNVQYTISDPGNLTDNAILAIAVIPNLGNTTFANDDANSGPQGIVQTGNLLTNDFDPEGNTQTVTAAVNSANTALVVDGVTANVLPSGGTLVLFANGAYTYTPAANFTGTEIIRYTATDNGLPVATDVATLYLTTITDLTAKLKLKVFLQGALYGTSSGLMRDDLRVGGHIPLTEPYTALSVGNPRFSHKGGGGGETTTLAVLNANAGTPNAIVDWVFVELRNKLDSSVVVITRSALLQRDGDVVSATDGTSMVTFPGQVGQNYFISVKHRNHLGAMLSSSVLMKNDSTVVDFINPTNTQLYNRPGSINYDGSEMVTVLTNKKALWAGNAQPNNKVKYQGVGTDNNPMLAQVLSFPGNTSSFYNYNLAFGYFTGDINMDGKVKYQGPGNDATFIFTNVVGLYSTLNTASLYNYDLFIEQLP